jgi:hypothetical protein
MDSLKYVTVFMKCSTKPWLHGKFDTFVHVHAVQARLVKDIANDVIPFVTRRLSH